MLVIEYKVCFPTLLLNSSILNNSISYSHTKNSDINMQIKKQHIWLSTDALILSEEDSCGKEFTAELIVSTTNIITYSN